MVCLSIEFCLLPFHSIVNVFLAGGIAASLPEEARKNSKYAQLLDAKRGITHGDNHAHAHH